MDPRLYRWQTSVRGTVRDRDDLQGKGFLKLASNRAGVLFYHGFARPPRNIYWQPLVDWWRKLLRLARQLAARQGLRVATGVTPSQSGVFHALDSVIQATRVTLALVFSGLALVISASLLLPLKDPPHGPGLAMQYGATFLFIGAWIIVKEGILEPQPTWRRIAWSQTLKVVSGMLAGLILLGILDAWKKSLAGDWPNIKQLLQWAAVIWVFAFAFSQSGAKPRRRRRRR